MYQITNLIMQAINNTQTFRKIGKSWYAGVSEGRFTLLNKEEAFCLEYLNNIGLLEQQDSFYEIFTCTPELMNLNPKLGMVFSYSSYNPKTSLYNSTQLNLQSGYKTYIFKS